MLLFCNGGGAQTKALRQRLKYCAGVASYGAGCHGSLILCVGGTDGFFHFLSNLHMHTPLLASKTMSLSSILYILKNHQFLVSSCIGIYELSRAFFPRKQSNTGYLTYYQSLKRLVRTPFSKSRRTSAPKICQINVFSCILYIETIHYEYSSSRIDYG